MPASVNAIQSCLALATPMLRPFPGVASSTRTTRHQSDKERRLIHSSTISGVPSSDPPSTMIISSGRRVCPATLDIRYSIESASFLTGTTSETFTPQPQKINHEEDRGLRIEDRVIHLILAPRSSILDSR